MAKETDNCMRIEHAVYRQFASEKLVDKVILVQVRFRFQLPYSTAFDKMLAPPVRLLPFTNLTLYVGSHSK